MSVQERETEANKLVLVTVTLVNETCEPNPIMSTDMILRGVDSVKPMDWDVLVQANPILNGNTGIALAPGTYCQLVLPFALNEHYFNHRTWHNLNNYQLFLQVTNSPTIKEIQVNG